MIIRLSLEDRTQYTTVFLIQLQQSQQHFMRYCLSHGLCLPCVSLADSSSEGGHLNQIKTVFKATRTSEALPYYYIDDPQKEQCNPSHHHII